MNAGAARLPPRAACRSPTRLVAGTVCSARSRAARRARPLARLALRPSAPRTTQTGAGWSRLE
eukprot:16434644-Heterocapsa_arctica.AAC.1